MSVGSVRSGFIFGVSWILDSTVLGNRGVRFVSEKNIVLKLLCVGLIRCFEIASLFLDGLYAEADCMEWT